jgi:hypothetical protein
MGKMKKNVHNDAITKFNTCLKNSSSMIKDLESRCECERFKSSHLQPT